MKKILILNMVLALVFSAMPSFALNIGTYQTESEYGLLDGFKINWKKKDKSTPFIEAREESSKKQREKERDEVKKDEYSYTKYMYEGKSIL